MNLTRKHTYLWSAALSMAFVLGAFAATPDAKPAATKEKEAPKPVEIPKAKFEYDNKKGKDPFFPKSVRWNPPPPKPPEVQVTPGNTVKPPEPPPKKNPYDFFALKGVTGVGNAKLVVINSGVKGKNYLLALGESKTVVTPEGNYKVKIEGFSDSGVVIKIDGEKASQELKLPTGP